MNLARSYLSKQTLWLMGILLYTTISQAQTLVVVDDHYGIPFGQPLHVEASGVLDNDTLDGEPAGENGAAAELVIGPSHGILQCPSDLSWHYARTDHLITHRARASRAVIVLNTWRSQVER